MATIQIDTREKPRAIEKILATFDAAEIPYISSKMYVGDYCLLENPLYIIDRKQNIAEIAANATSGHGRMKRELERLKKIGGQMVFLIEQNKYKDPNGHTRIVFNLEDIMFWQNPHGVVDGIQVYKVLSSWQAKYPVSYRFCGKRETGTEILSILERGLAAKKQIEGLKDVEKD